MAVTNAIRVQVEELQSAQKEFNQIIKDMDSSSKAITQSVNNTVGKDWTGEAANSYKKQYDTLYQNVEKILKQADNFSTDMATIVDQYKATEETNRDTASKLETNLL